VGKVILVLRSVQSAFLADCGRPKVFSTKKQETKLHITNIER
jgi:hypothetical protein